jgi:hypothetical protein
MTEVMTLQLLLAVGCPICLVLGYWLGIMARLKIARDVEEWFRKDIAKWKEEGRKQFTEESER